MNAHGRFDSRGSGDFVQLALSEIRLLLPQDDVHTLESVADMVPAVGPADTVGRFELAGRVWPVYALSVNLRPRPRPSGADRVAVLMKPGPDSCGLLCEQISVVARSEVALFPVPACMHRPPSPLLGLALHRGTVLCVSSASALESSFRELTGGSRTAPGDARAAAPST